jgi:D-alanyl-D-alanine-carboxypeptidase/D-alanyl-D-alanine-endopeptidase
MLSCSAAAYAEDGATLPAPVASYLERGVAQGSWPRVVSAHVLQSTTSLATYPVASADGIGGDSRFLLGDAMAAINGLLLAELATSGRVRLDDPISRYLPLGFPCADARVCALTLQQLAAHSSGLPPMPANLFAADAENLWHDYQETDLLDFLTNYRLPAEPAARQSALGQILLAWLLGRAHGGGYAAALSERVTEPLGLRATGVGAGNVAEGHRDGRATRSAAGPSPLPAQLYSSVNDQVRLLRAMLRPGESPLRAALMVSRQPRDARANWGLGWRISMVTRDEQTWPLVWQAASSGGHTVFLGFRTDRQEAVALFGTAEASLAALGLSVLDGSKLPPLPAPATVVSGDSADYVGLYEFAPGTQLLIRVTAEGLTAQTSGRLALRLVPLGPDLFGAAGAPVQLSFQRDSLGKIETLRWSENGFIVPVQRLSRRAPALPRTEQAISADKLRDYCGDYVVDSDVLARFHCDARPALQFSGAQRRELFAYADDRFASRDGEFELIARRDAKGQVDALTLVLLGNETPLPRTQWRSLPAEITANLQHERVVRDESARAAIVERAAAADTSATRAVLAPAPWAQLLPVLAPRAVVPYRPPGNGSHARTSAAAPVSASAKQSPDRPDVRSTRAGPPANVRPAPAAAPAQIEALPERFERPRFAPSRSAQPEKETTDDGT